MGPKPPTAPGAPGNPGRPSSLPPLGGPTPPTARGDPGNRARHSTLRPLMSGPDMAVDHSVLIGVDVGGTTIAAGAVTADGEVLHDENVLTHDAAAAGTLVTIERLVQRVSGALAARGLTLAGIGVGVPGPVDAGVVGAPPPHPPDLIGQPLGPPPPPPFRVPAFLHNHRNAPGPPEVPF